jgi:outer membrane lipoprotein
MLMTERCRIIGGTGAVAALLLLSACATQEVIPKELEPQVDRNVTFLQVQQAPYSYKDRVIVLGGEVLSVKRERDHSRVEVLQLPVDSSLEPVQERTKSLGRFLAVQRQMLDPATLPVGTRVTIVGQVVGGTTLPIGETAYNYPLLEVKHIKTWEPSSPSKGPSGFSIGVGGGVIGGGRGGGFGGVGGGVGF